MRDVKNKLAFYGSTTLVNILTIFVLTGMSVGWWVQTNSGVAINVAPEFALNAPKQPKIKSGVPVSVSVPSLGLELRVKQGQYNPKDGSWSLDKTNAFFAKPSVPVNDTRGTSLIYGHNISNVFGRLKNITPGAKLIIKTENNYQFEYKYSFVTEVFPQDTSIFNNETAPNVTLQTCSGDWDELRSMYSFTFQKVAKVS